MKLFKAILSIAFLFLFQSLDAHAQAGEPPVPPVPNDSVVLDTLDWLSPSQESEINAINRNLDQDGTAQIAVVTLDDCGGDPQKFRNDLFRTWGIGHANDNDGLLILVCWYGGDKSRRSLEQETGYGLEGTLPDILTGRIADEYFVPAFQEDRPGEGLLTMVKQYDRILRQNGETSESVPPSNVDSGIGWLITGLLGLLPGYVLSRAYPMTASPRRVRTPRGKWVEIPETPRRRARPFVVAEIISLLPILAILFIIQQFAVLSSTIQEYGQFILPKLLLWLVFLVVYLISLFSNYSGYNSGGGWYSGNDDWGSGTGGYGGFPDSGSDSPDFGGGDSGGGGSSTRF